MSPIEIKSLGFKLVKQVPDSVDEFDRLAKENGAALREANRNVLYRSTLAEFRNTFLHGSDADGDRPAIVGLDASTGIDRKSKITRAEERDAENNIIKEEQSAWAETEDEFFSRVCAELTKSGQYPSVEAAQASLASQAQTVLDSIPFDPSKTERKSAGPKKIPNTYMEVAKEIVNAKGGDVDAACAAFTRKTALEVNPKTVEALAAAVWADQKAQKAKIAASYG